MKVINIVGARPNFIKMAPLLAEMSRFGSAFNPILVHTGQHYDDNMSGSFFRDLNIREPDVYLGVGAGSHAYQTARMMVEFEKLCMEEEPDLILVVGDVNSTLACSLTASKLCIPVAHVEAGLRSFDRTMPEEINRMVTDILSDYLFTTCEDANENLCREGIAEHKIHFVGNVMVDTLLKFRDKAQGESAVLNRMGLLSPNSEKETKDYAVATLHRPSNVEDRERLSQIIGALKKVAENIPVLFSVHPRTRKQLEAFGFSSDPLVNCFSGDVHFRTGPRGLCFLDPLGYLDFIRLMNGARMVFTDSGGIQEETTVLGVPCLTLRENTERPVTVSMGTNRIVGTDGGEIVKQAMAVLSGEAVEYKLPPLWDGKAAQRIIKILRSHY